MSDNHGRSPKQSDGLHGDSGAKCYAEVRFFKWQEADTSVSLRSRSGSYGGGSEVFVVEPIIFADHVTMKIDGGGRSVNPRPKGLQMGAMRSAEDNWND